MRTVIRGDKIAKLIFSRPLPHPPGHREVGNAEYGGDDEGEECQWHLPFHGHSWICSRRKSENATLMDKILFKSEICQFLEIYCFMIIFQKNSVVLESLLWPRREERKWKNLRPKRAVWVCNTVTIDGGRTIIYLT